MLKSLEICKQFSYFWNNVYLNMLQFYMATHMFQKLHSDINSWDQRIRKAPQSFLAHFKYKVICFFPFFQR